MKKIICLVFVVTLCFYMCACSAKENNNVNKDLRISDCEKMTVEEMKQFYNTEELVGTPSMGFYYFSCKGKDAETFRVTREIYDETGFNVIFEKEYYIENTIRMNECICTYPCIFVDNNTPDDYEDDQFAFVFNWIYN